MERRMCSRVTRQCRTICYVDEYLIHQHNERAIVTAWVLPSILMLYDIGGWLSESLTHVHNIYAESIVLCHDYIHFRNEAFASKIERRHCHVKWPDGVLSSVFFLIMMTHHSLEFRMFLNYFRLFGCYANFDVNFHYIFQQCHGIFLEICIPCRFRSHQSQMRVPRYWKEAELWPQIPWYWHSSANYTRTLHSVVTQYVLYWRSSRLDLALQTWMKASYTSA